MLGRRPWQEELAIIDNTMRAISGITDPEKLVEAYWNGIGDLIPIEDYVSISRRNVEPPAYLVTRSSRFTENYNPWTQRDRLPRLTGGLLGEIAYANQPVIINDLSARLKDNDPAHFYLHGFASLVALPQYDGGEALNVTCMLMPPGHELDPAVIPMLHWQSGLFGRGTQNLVLRNQLSAALAQLDQELQTVGEIQKSLLPRLLPPIDGFELATWYQTSARAGGDYYDFFPLSGGAHGIFIADVSGHGTPAAVLMAITHAIAHTQPGTHTPPPELLRHLNDHLSRSYTHDGTFVTAFYAVLDPHSHRLTYSIAGHNPPRLVRAGQILPLYENAGLPLGILADQRYGESSITLERGDLLLLYTDGIIEARSAATRQFFGLDRLDDLLLNCGASTPRDCINRIRSELTAWSPPGPPIDDQTLIAIRCT